MGMPPRLWQSVICPAQSPSYEFIQKLREKKNNKIASFVREDCYFSTMRFWDFWDALFSYKLAKKLPNDSFSPGLMADDHDCGWRDGSFDLSNYTSHHYVGLIMIINQPEIRQFGDS